MIMFEAFYPEDIEILMSSSRITHIACVRPPPFQSVGSAFWKARSATFREAVKRLVKPSAKTRRMLPKLVMRYGMISTYSRELGGRVNPNLISWWRRLRRCIQRNVRRLDGLALTMINPEVQGAAGEGTGVFPNGRCGNTFDSQSGSQEGFNFDVYDVHHVTEMMIRAGWGCSGFQCDFGMASGLSQSRARFNTEHPGDQPNGYRQQWAGKTMSRFQFNLAYWLRRVDQTVKGDGVQLALQNKYVGPTCEGVVEAIDADENADRDWYLFPYTNNSTQRAKEIVELLG